MIALSPALRGRFDAACGVHRPQLEGLARKCGGDALEFAQAVVQYGYLDRDGAGEMVAAEAGHTYVNLGKTLFQDEEVAKVPVEIARRVRAIPLYRLGDAVTVAMAGPADAKSVGALETFLGSRVSPVLSFPDEIESAILVKYRPAVAFEDVLVSFDFSRFDNVELTDARLAELVQSQQMVEIGDALVQLALQDRASDIHVEPKKDALSIRLRVDGVMRERLSLPPKLALPLVSRIKVAAGLDITERRLPQDGRLGFEVPGRKVDLRISTLPTLHGEKLVMRILGSHFAGAELNLEKLDIVPEVLTPLKHAIQQPNGILFVTGPTGSGKSTSLYAALNFINRPDINVVAIEDPVEY